MNLLSKAAMVAVAASAVVAAGAGPASASTVTPDWYGGCAPISFTSTSFKGWCDGNGPDSYRTYVRCSADTAVKFFGELRWAGDRRGSTATCPSGWGTRAGYGYDLVPA